MTTGTDIALRVDQVLLHDVLGTLAMLEFEAIGRQRIRIKLAAKYIDHKLVQADHMNAGKVVRNCLRAERAAGRPH